MLKKPAVPAIECPNCGHSVPLDEALTRQIAAPLLARREEDLRREAQEQARADFTQQLDDLESSRQELQDQVEERDNKIKKLETQEIQLRKAKRQLDDEKAAWDVERERMRDEITAEERKKATQLAAEQAQQQMQRKEAEHQTQVRQLEDQLARVKDQLAEAERKARTGSRQEEGYARQEVFRDDLQRRFPGDWIEVTKRGAKGGDIIHQVRTGGQVCGTILWECKDTATWQNIWPGKLADDVQRAGASVGIIVSTTLPAGVEGCDEISNVLVCGYEVAAALAAGLRKKIISDRWHEITSASTDAGQARLYKYVMTGDFVTRFTTMGRQLSQLLAELESDRRALQQRWKRTQRRIEELTDTLYAIPLEIQEAIGADAELPAGLRVEVIAADQMDEPSAAPAGQVLALE